MALLALKVRKACTVRKDPKEIQAALKERKEPPALRGLRGLRGLLGLKEAQGQPVQAAL